MDYPWQNWNDHKAPFVLPCLWPVLMRVASAYEVVTIPDEAAIPSALARDMGIAPEITRVRGRAGNMALVHVPFRGAPSVMP